jgi:hypothetical protein
MKTTFAVSILTAATLSACNTVTPEQMNQSLANAATLIANGCKVVQPTLAATAVGTANVGLGAAAAANGVFCAADQAAVAGSASAPVAAAPAK